MLGRPFAPLCQTRKGNEGIGNAFFLHGLTVSGCIAQKTKLKKVVNMDWRDCLVVCPLPSHLIHQGSFCTVAEFCAEFCAGLLVTIPDHEAGRIFLIVFHDFLK